MAFDPTKPRRLLPGETCSVRIFDADGHGDGVTEVFRSATSLLEAPNWMGAHHLILNGDGSLWRLDLRDGTLDGIATTGLPPLNNDHMPAPDGDTMFVSGFDWHIYRLSLSSGIGERITQVDTGRQRLHFLHGVSPAGDELAFVGIALNASCAFESSNIFTLALDDGHIRQLTFGSQRDDGCEYSPDGDWIYCNTEAFANSPGHAQIARLPRRGGALERLTFDDRVNWFPHLAPTGDLACYLSYPPKTIGHPPGCDVQLRLVRGGDWSRPETVAQLRGGQGTINVNSWSPDGRRFAFVSYPIGAGRPD